MLFDWLPERIAEATAHPRLVERGWATFVLNPAATETEIRQCEASLGVPLPPSYCAFLRHWNGASLFRNVYMSPLPDGRASVNAEIGVLSTRALVARTQAVRTLFDADSGGDEPSDWGDLLLCGSIPGTGGGDYCGLDPHQNDGGEYAVLDCFHEVLPRCWKQVVIASSFHT